MVVSGAPRCHQCGADLDWGEVRCPYCGTLLVPRGTPSWGGLVSGPFPRELQVERRGRWRVRHRLFDDDALLGAFTQHWHGGVEFLSPQGHLYRFFRRSGLRLTLLWVCGGDVVAWFEQLRPLGRRYDLHYGGATYNLLSTSWLSPACVLRDEERRVLLQIKASGRFRSPMMTVRAPLSLELVGMVYALYLLLRRQPLLF